MKQLLILLLSVFMLSTAPAWVKSIDLPPLHGLSARLLLASLFLSVISYKKLIREIKKNHLGPIFGVGLILFLHFWTWFAGLKEVTVSLCATIFAVNPIFSALLGAVILKEEFKKRYFLSLILAIGGVIYSTLGDTLFTRAEIPGVYSSKGVILIMVSSFLYALYMVLSKFMRRSLSNGAFTIVLNATAFVWAFGFLSFLSFTPESPSLITTYQEGLNPTTIFALLGVVLGPSILGHTLMIYSLPFFNINFVGILKLLSPISASIIGVIIFKDQFDQRLLISLCLVVSGVLVALPWERGFQMVNAKKSRQNPKDPPSP